VLGNVAELCAESNEGAPSEQKPSWDSLSSIVRGGSATDGPDKVNVRVLQRYVIQDDPTRLIGVRPACDIRPPQPDSAGANAPAGNRPNQSANESATKQNK
jgi:hypothetical protein